MVCIQRQKHRILKLSSANMFVRTARHVSPGIGARSRLVCKNGSRTHEVLGSVGFPGLGMTCSPCLLRTVAQMGERRTKWRETHPHPRPVGRHCHCTECPTGALEGLLCKCPTVRDGKQHRTPQCPTSSTRTTFRVGNRSCRRSSLREVLPGCRGDRRAVWSLALSSLLSFAE